MNSDRSIPLFKQYPDLEKSLPRLALGNYPTPVEKLQKLGKKRVWIKRDDATSSIYGGNKVRKLEFILGDVLSKKKKKIVTMGGIGTNHGLATAIFCKEIGIDCRLLLFHQPVTENVKTNLRLFSHYRAKQVYRKSLFATALAYYTIERLYNPGAFFLFAGGSTPVGTAGFVNAVFELKSQIDEGQMPEPQSIVCPLGSGGTLAGITLGVALAGLKSTVIGVRVTPDYLGPLQTCTIETVMNLVFTTHRFLKRLTPQIPDVNIQPPLIIDDYYGDGYGCTTPECMNAMYLMEDREHITLDPTYTSKTFAAVLDLCEGFTGSDQHMLYWHTYNSVDTTLLSQTVHTEDVPSPLRSFLESGQ